MLGKSLTPSNMTHRRATHSGSWYSKDEDVLNEQLTTWLAKANPLPSPEDPENELPPPIPNAKWIIAPHAGYRYSGPTAAYAYAALDTSTIDRVILLGPSHHEYVDGCALSPCDVFETPFGSFEADNLDDFKKTGLFSFLSVAADEKEHSLEMQLPYLYKRFQDDGRPIPKVILILVSRLLTKARTELYARFLASQVTSRTGVVISTDFCHFGPGFRFTPTFSTPTIHEGIEQMDREGMHFIQQWDADQFEEYISATRNTICGRFPLKLFIHIILNLKKKKASLVWTHYDQSTRIQKNSNDHSVSYVSGYVVVEEEL